MENEELEVIEVDEEVELNGGDTDEVSNENI